MIFATDQEACPATIAENRHWRGLARRMATAWLFCFVLLTPALGQQSVEKQKIDYLIASVAALKDATFIRNGTSYDAEQAASHMRLKLRMAGSRVQTAEDFIVYCATGSSMSGTRYTIHFSDGRTVDAATFLRDRLAAYRPQTLGAKPQY
jgi:hypothetical protein